MKDGECNGCLPNPPRTDESDGFEIFGQPDNLLDQFAASKQALGGAGEGNSPRGMLLDCKTVEAIFKFIMIADLTW